MSRGEVHVPDVNASLNVSMSFLSAKDLIASVFLLLHASEPVLDSLTNAAAYRLNIDMSCAYGGILQKASEFRHHSRQTSLSVCEVGEGP